MPNRTFFYYSYEEENIFCLQTKIIKYFTLYFPYKTILFPSSPQLVIAVPLIYSTLIYQHFLHAMHCAKIQGCKITITKSLTTSNSETRGRDKQVVNALKALTEAENSWTETQRRQNVIHTTNDFKACSELFCSYEHFALSYSNAISYTDVFLQAELVKEVPFISSDLAHLASSLSLLKQWLQSFNTQKIFCKCFSNK